MADKDDDGLLVATSLAAYAVTLEHLYFRERRGELALRDLAEIIDGALLQLEQMETQSPVAALPLAQKLLRVHLQHIAAKLPPTDEAGSPPRA